MQLQGPRVLYGAMRQHPPAPLALGQQLAEWRQPLDEDPAVEEAVMRMLRALDRYLQRDQRPQGKPCRHLAARRQAESVSLELIFQHRDRLG